MPRNMQKAQEMPAENEQSQGTPEEFGGVFRRGIASFRESPAFAAFIAMISIFIVMAFMGRNFLTSGNLLNITRQSAILAIIAIGQTMLFISGSFDLSVAAVTSMSTVVLTQIITADDTPWIPAALLALVLGALVGLLNGILVAGAKIPPMIVTLGMATAVEGIGLTVTQSYGVTLPSGSPVNFLGKGSIGPIPFLVVVMLVFYAIFHFVMKRTKLGRVIYGLGGNQDAVRLSGIPVVRYRIITFVLCSALAAFAGILLTGRIGSGHATSSALGMQMDSIAATLMGGVVVTGGVGSMMGTLVGVFILGIINNGLNMALINPYVQLVCKGIIMIAAVGMGALRKRR